MERRHIKLTAKYFRIKWEVEIEIDKAKIAKLIEGAISKHLALEINMGSEGSRDDSFSCEYLPPGNVYSLDESSIREAFKKFSDFACEVYEMSKN